MALLEAGRQWSRRQLSHRGHDHVHRELLSTAGSDLHRHCVGQDEARAYQEVVATPEHTWKAEGRSE